MLSKSLVTIFLMTCRSAVDVSIARIQSRVAKLWQDDVIFVAYNIGYIYQSLRNDSLTTACDICVSVAPRSLIVYAT
jgi:hypothetical protein